MLVYLAGPIDAVGHDQSRTWRAHAADKLAEVGVWSYNPVLAFHPAESLPFRPWDRDDMRSVMAVNEGALDCCDALLAFLPRNWPTFGSHREIQYAVDRNIPVIVVSDWLGNGRMVSASDLRVVESLDSAVDWLDDLNRGVNPAEFDWSDGPDADRHNARLDPDYTEVSVIAEAHFEAPAEGDRGGEPFAPWVGEAGGEAVQDARVEPVGGGAGPAGLPAEAVRPVEPADGADAKFAGFVPGHRMQTAGQDGYPYPVAPAEAVAGGGCGCGPGQRCRLCNTNSTPYRDWRDGDARGRAGGGAGQPVRSSTHRRACPGGHYGLCPE